MATTNNTINTRLYPITKRPNPLFSLNDKHIIAVGNPEGKDLKNTFKKENIEFSTTKEKKLFKETGLDDIDPANFYLGGIKRKYSRRRRPSMYKKKRTYRRKSRTALKRRKSTKRR